MRLIGLIFGFFFISNLCSGQARPSKWNFDYQYDADAIVKCQHKVWEQKDSLGIYLKLTFNAKYAKANQLHKRYSWNFDFRITTSYDTKATIYEASFTSSKYQISENEFLFYFETPKILESSAYMYIAYFQDEKGKVFIQDIPLKILDKELFSEHILFESDPQIPIFDKFINKKDTFAVRSSYGNHKIPLHYFRYNFAPALPPMATVNAGDQDVKIHPDSTIIVLNDSLNVPFKKGNYYIPSVMPKKSLLFYVVENRFPKVTKTKELIDPTIYIATDDERKALKNTQKPKVKLDDFWLTLAQDKDFARKMIKNYYSNVQEANIFFTQYKEGWKTDMGMIYIIFGKPDQVYRQDLKETWKYKNRQSIPALNFVFNKRINPFGEHFFELQNAEEYGNVWFNTVELWRKGILED